MTRHPDELWPPERRREREEASKADARAAYRERYGVTADYIKAQRTQGWPDMHPEDYCHRCGQPNMLWVADREDWLTATSAWAAETGREGICCVSCFARMHEAATGQRTIWRVSPSEAPKRDAEATGGETGVQSHTAVVRPVSGDSEALARVEALTEVEKWRAAALTLEAERDALRAEVERLKGQNRKLINGILPLQAECPAPGGCGNCALCHRDIARDCIRLANKRLRDAGRRPMPEGLWDVLALADRAEAAEAIVAQVEALAEEWEEATVWPDEPHRQLRGAAARLRIALSGDAP